VGGCPARAWPSSPPRPGSTCRHLDELSEAVGKDVGTGDGAGTGPGWSAARHPGREIGDDARSSAEVSDDDATKADTELTRVLSELRLIKDDFEIQEMRRAIEVTAGGFTDIVRALPAAVRGGPG